MKLLGKLLRNQNKDSLQPLKFHLFLFILYVFLHYIIY